MSEKCRTCWDACKQRTAKGRPDYRGEFAVCVKVCQIDPTVPYFQMCHYPTTTKTDDKIGHPSLWDVE